MKSAHLALFLLLCFAGCAVTPDDVPDNVVHLANVTILTPGLETAQRGIVFYPPELYSSGISGRIKVSLELDGSGQVTVAQVTESNEPRFEVPSIKGALKWQFKPGPRKGEILFEFVSPNPTQNNQTGAPDGATLKPATDIPSGDYILVEDADVKPKLILPVQPIYPSNAAKLNLNGSVDFTFIIDTEGKTTQIHVVKATSAEFAASAVAAVAKWRFSPGIKNGKPVACFGRQNIDFSLDH